MTSHAERDDEAVVGHDLMIGGVKVRFPYKPYPAQTVLMSKVTGFKTCQDGNILS